MAVRAIGRNTRFLALGALAVVTSLSALVGAGPADASRSSPLAHDRFERALLDEINSFRAHNGLESVRVSHPLRTAADGHSAAMARRGFFGHESESGQPFWTWIRAWYVEAPYAYWSVGQNLLWVPHGVSAKVAFRMWLGSPSHRTVLLRPRWREIGLSAVRATRAPGFFRGADVTIVTANFGVRR